MSNWIIFNLLFASLIHGHFYFFNFIFEGKTEPCVGMTNPYDSTTALFNNISTFTTVYVTTISLQFAVILFSAIMIGCSKGIKYSKLVNPIVFFGPLLVTQWVVLRVGVISGHFGPNALSDPNNIILNYFTNGTYIGIFGIIP